VLCEVDAILSFIQTQKEVADMATEVQDLEVALAAKTPPMMVVHTRLENRTCRPNVELCRDEPQYGMVEEVAKITDAMQALQDKINVAK
jgi:tektin-2